MHEIGVVKSKRMEPVVKKKLLIIKTFEILFLKVKY